MIKYRNCELVELLGVSDDFIMKRFKGGEKTAVEKLGKLERANYYYQASQLLHLQNLFMKEKVRNFLYKKNRQQQIKGFYYAARFHSISEAARVMNLTQSTVTLQIQSLERDLGRKLFKRDSKPLTLTADGEDFYQLACPLIHEFESVVEKFLNHKKEKEQKKIDIAMHHIAISYMMPKVIHNLKKSHPDLKIMIRNIAPSEALKRLKDGEIDMAFYPNLPHEPEIEQIEIISYDPVLIMNKHHPLAKRGISALRDLKNFDLIRIDSKLITLPFFEEVVKVNKIEGSIEFENGNWEMLKHFVKDNPVVAVVSQICLDKNDNDLVVKNLSNFFPKMDYTVAVKKGVILKPTTEALLGSILGVCKNLKYVA